MYIKHERFNEFCRALFTLHKTRYDILETEIRDENNTTQRQLASMAIHSLISMLVGRCEIFYNAHSMTLILARDIKGL
jgi:hypothetical protein